MGANKSTRLKRKRKGGRTMSKKSTRIAMILVVAAMAFVAVAQHFGWIAGPPPLLAPGVQ
jgi:hypothetical protein